MIEYKLFDSPGHELVVVASDNDTNFLAVIAIHNTELGPALGGIRMKAYDGPVGAVVDALRLSEGMTYKNAAAGLPFGGGKSVIVAAEWNSEVSYQFAEFLNYVNDELGVEYYGAPDMNTNNGCMFDIQESGSDKVVFNEDGGDCSESTAYGVLQSLLALQTFSNIEDASKMTVNIEGLGKVGARLAKYCKDAGFDVCVSDIDKDKALAMASYHGYAFAAPEDISYLPGVYCPCAVGETVTKEWIKDTEAFAVCGAANNQLDKIDTGKFLAINNILYIPDFIANAGGVISVGVAVENGLNSGFGLENPHVLERVEFIRSQARAILMAQTTNIETRNAQLLAIKAVQSSLEK